MIKGDTNEENGSCRSFCGRYGFANTFNFDLGLKYFVSLSQLDKGKFNENECKEKLLECYTSGYGEVTIGSIIEMAREKGFIYKGSSEGS